MGIHTPTIIQVEAVECGAAALAMILAYHGRHIRLEDLRVECGVSRDGSKASNILQCARRHGLVASGKRLELPRLAEIKLPVIVFVNMNHFLVLEAVTRHGYRLNDPAMGRRIVDAAEFDEMFTGITLSFEPGPDFHKTTAPSGQISTLARYLGRERSAVALIVITGLGLIVPGLAIPAFTRVFVDYYLMSSQTDWLFAVGMLMLCVILLQAGLMYLRSMYNAKLEAKLALTINTTLVWRLLRLPIPFFGQRYAGALAARGQMALQVSTLASQTSLSVALEAATVVFFLAVMASYSVSMASLSAVLLILSGALVFSMGQRLKQVSIKTSTEMMTLAGKTMIGLQSIESIKSSGTEDRFFSSWSGTHAHVVNGQASLALPQALLVAAPGFVSFFGKAITLVIGGNLVMAGSMTIGSLVAFQALLAAIDQPFRQLVDDTQKLLQAQGPLSQVRDVTEYPAAQEFSTDNPRVLPLDGAAAASTRPARAARLSGEVKVRDLAFGYSPLAAALLSDFRLDIAPGRRIALVGGSGSGKSTIGKLLAGVYGAWQGTIEFDGIDIGNIERAVLRNSISIVDQNVFLFEASFRDNIRLWDTTITDDAVMQAARDAMIHEFVATSKEGYDALVEEGGRNMSGGQRQRVEIARALARDASILILDEATSALDPIVEAKVMENITRRGCTCIIIAHRLSTIRDCDEILVLDRGTVVQRGTHESMRNVDGPYRRLIEA